MSNSLVVATLEIMIGPSKDLSFSEYLKLSNQPWDRLEESDEVSIRHEHGFKCQLCYRSYTNYKHLYNHQVRKCKKRLLKHGYKKFIRNVRK